MTLPITRSEYFDLIDWTGRQLRCDKKGAIPSHIKPILQRLDLNENQWIPSVQQYRNRFHVMVVKLSFLQDFAKRLNRFWFKGKAGVSALYRVVENPG